MATPPTERTTRNANLKLDTSVYLITDRKLAGSRGVLYAVERALEGDGRGRRATIVQLRDKECDWEDSVALGRSLRAATRRAGALLIVNDSLELAVEVEADGVHVGQGDAAASLVRPHVDILGVSAGNVTEAMAAIGAGADYIGVGPVYRTRTKKDARNPIGTTGLRAVCEAVHGRKVPVVAIGGINGDNARAVKAAGADGVAVISAVMSAERPEQAAAQLSTTMLKDINSDDDHDYE